MKLVSTQNLILKKLDYVTSIFNISKRHFALKEFGWNILFSVLCSIASIIMLISPNSILFVFGLIVILIVVSKKNKGLNFISFVHSNFYIRFHHCELVHDCGIN